MAQRKVFVGAKLELRGEPCEITEMNVEYTEYGGVVKNDGVRIVFDNGVQRVLPRKYASSTLKHAGTKQLREVRYQALMRQAREIVEAVGGQRWHAEGWIAKMDAGEPCAQLTFTEEQLTQLHQLVTGDGGSSALEDVLD